MGFRSLPGRASPPAGLLPVAVAALLLAGCGGGDEPPPAPPTGEARLQGVVQARLELGLGGGAGFFEGQSAHDQVPVTGATLRGERGAGDEVVRDASIAGGRFDLTFAAPGPATVLVWIDSDSGWAHAAWLKPELTVGRTLLPEPVELVTAATVWGRAVRADGAPATGALVRAEGTGLVAGVADDGSWLLGGLPPGEHELVLAHPETLPEVRLQTPLLVSAMALEVTLPPLPSGDPDEGLRIGGSVLDEESGFAVPLALIRAGQRWTRADRTGQFSLVLPAPVDRIHAEASGYQPAELPVAMQAGLSQSFEIVLERGRQFGQGAARLRVVQAGGEPVRGIPVRALGTGIAGETDPEGRVVLQLPSGCHPLAVGSPPTALRHGCVRAGRTTDLGTLLWNEAGELCIAVPERCDGRDNNCNGRIDDGCDTIPPDPVRADLVVVHQLPPGNADWVTGLAGAAEPLAIAEFRTLAVLPQVLGRIPVAADGSFGPLDLGDNEVGGFSIVLEDAAENRSAPVAFANDIVPPATVFVDRPPVLSRSPDALFSFAANEAADFECRLDGGAWEPCSSPHAVSGLALGAHSFAVRGTDLVDNLESPGPAWNWFVEPAVIWAWPPTDAQGQPLADLAPVEMPLIPLEAAAGTDVLVADKQGRVRRLSGRDGSAIWSRQIATGDALMGAPLLLGTDDPGLLELVLPSEKLKGFQRLAPDDGLLLGDIHPLTAPVTLTYPVTKTTFLPVAAQRAPGALPRATGLPPAWASYAERSNEGILLQRFSRAVTTPLASRHMTQPTGLRARAPLAVVDLDGDGETQVLLAADVGLYALRATDFSTRWVTAPGVTIFGGPSQAALPVDIDGSGLPEILVRSGSNRIAAIAGADGALLWEQAVAVGGVLAPWGVGDLSGDGRPVLVAVDDGGRVSAWELAPGGATQLWQADLAARHGGSPFMTASPLLVDLDGDGLVDVLVGESGGNGRLFGLRGTDGSDIFRFTLGQGIWATPMAADLNRDGRVAIVAAGHGTDGTGRVRAFETAGLARPDAQALAAWGGDPRGRTLAADPGEPNDSEAGALALGALDGAIRWSALAEAAGRSDFYAVAVTRTGRVWFRLDPIPAGAVLNLHVGRVGEAPLAAAMNTTAPVGVDFDADDRLTLELEITTAPSAPAVRYGLTVTQP